MKFSHFLLPPLSLALSMALAAQSTPAAAPQANSRVQQEAAELQELRAKFSEVLDKVNESWFGKPYEGIRAVDLNGNIAIVFNDSAVGNRIQQLTQGAVSGAGIQSGQAFGTLSGTYFANGDHLYNITGDFGVMRFQRAGERGFWYLRDQNVYTTAINLAPPNAPASFMGWFISLMADIKDVYVNGPAFTVTKGSDTTIRGNAASTIVFNAPTAAYDPTKREQPASDTFGFWKRGRLEIAYDPATLQPLRTSFTNVAQGIEATLNFTYDANGRIRRVAIDNRSKQWESPGFVSASYGNDGMIAAISGEIAGESHKISFNLSTAWNRDKSQQSILSVVPPIATRLGREDMQLRIAMMFASNIGDLQKAGFNFMMPKVGTTTAAPAVPTSVPN